MLPYYITFLISCIFCYMGEKSMRNDLNSEYKNSNYNTNIGKYSIKNSKIYIKRISIKKASLKESHLYFFLSVLSVALLAGFRAYTVGTDVHVYGNDLFYYAKQVSFSTFLERLPNIEPLYLILVHISTFFSEEPHILYFFTGLIIYSFILAGILSFKDRIPTTFSWFCFLCLLYGDTYNAMRQCIAIAISFWAFHYAKERKYIAYIFGTVVAFLFHNSAIICVFVLAIYTILQKNNKFWIKVLLVITTVVGLTFFNQILILLMGTGILDAKMSRYFIGESSGLSIPAILIRLPFLIMILIQKKQFCYGSNSGSYLRPLKNEAEADFLIILLFAEMFSVELSAFVSSLYRISLYFVIFRCLAYARIYGVQKKKNKIVYAGLLIIYLLIIFIYQNQIKGNNEIYPYVFGIF